MLLQKVSKVAGVGAVGGYLIIAGASHAAALDTTGITGPNSYSNISSLVSDYFNSLNNNNIFASTPTTQTANGGSSQSNGNTVGNGSLLGLPGFGVGGGGNASNMNGSVTSVSVGNSSLAGMFGMSTGSYGGSTIGLTGPNSYNAINNSYNTYFSTTNLNNIFAFTTTGQTANGGWSQSNGNTVAGGGNGGGSASNSNTGLTNVSINNGGLGGNWSATSNGAVALGNSGLYLTGPNSYNVVNSSTNMVYSSSNTNNVNAATTTGQTANGGSSESNGNTIGAGGNGGGSASNSNAAGTVVSVSNGTPTITGSYTSGTMTYGGTIGLTGPNSYNVINNSNNTTVSTTNTNNVNASTTTNQNANGGSSESDGNTVAGSGSGGSTANASQGGTGVTVNN